MIYQKLCDDVIEAHEELNELIEAIALIDKDSKDALQLVKEYYKLICNLRRNLQVRLMASSSHQRSSDRRAALKAIEDETSEDETSDDGHIELENGQSLTFESQLLQMEYKRMIDEINNTHKD